MEVLYYTDLDFSKVKKQFEKTVNQLKAGNWTGAEIKKMQNTGYYRARLDAENRLLFKFAKHKGKTYILILEVILNHDYRSSRFLNGAILDESKLQSIDNEGDVAVEDMAKMPYINPRSARFNLLDKVISFDDDQQDIFQLPPPLIVIGSAGSGKTALTLEKIKILRGGILYVTLSPYLVENSAHLYYANKYQNEDQDIDFLSFKEFVETLRIPEGKEVTYKAFDDWFTRHRNTVKVRDSYKIYEEFKGVLTGMSVEKEYLNREEYLALGVRQSVFLNDEREQIYGLFEKYLVFLKENKLYDLNMVSFRWQGLVKPKYDFVVVDEVQDLTNTQLFLILKSLKTAGNFVLCGDSNQIVHPNFFSWANVKTMFYNQDSPDNDLRILRTNYRNSPQVTDVANKLLKVKNARFGSIDRESTYLVNAISEKEGEVICLADTPKVKQELNQKTKNSANYAVVVMTNEDKAEARKLFQTPLLFSVQEAKGLEYENIILVNFVSNKTKEFIEITEGVTKADVAATDIRYARAKDKTDKSLDAYKFYINSLYVAMTRAVRNLYVLETSQKHPLLNLLDLVDLRQLKLAEQKSSLEDWQREARRLEMQGKQEQADLIKQNILGNQKTPWTPITMAELQTLMVEALNPEAFNKKAKDRLFDFALVYNNTDIFEKLVVLKYRRAEKPEAERSSIMRRSYAQYAADDVKKVTENIKKYGLDYRDEFNMTPLLAALKTGATKVIDFLLAQDANQNVTDNLGINPFQMALQQAHSNTKFLQTRLPELYHKLQPDHIKIKLEGHLVKVSARSMAFFLLQNFLVTQTPILEQRDNNLKDNGLTMDDIMDFVEKFDTRILPEFRQKRQYVNSIMAKNEIDGKDVYNKKLFLRLGRGVYVVNPDLDIQIADGEWLNVYTLMNTEKMTREHDEALKAEAHKIQQDERQAAILKWQKQREAERKRAESERFDKFGNWNW